MVKYLYNQIKLGKLTYEEVVEKRPEYKEALDAMMK